MALSHQPYDDAVANTRGVGRYIGKFLYEAVRESQGKMKLKNIHLVGFSLGAHIMGHRDIW